MGLPLRTALDTPQEWNLFRGWLLEIWDYAASLPYFEYARGPWSPEVQYSSNDYVTESGVTYVAMRDHTSGSDFTADLASGNWLSFNSQSFSELVSQASVQAHMAAQQAGLASASADVATGLANRWPTTALGLANTAVGRYFSTPSPEEGESSIIWRNVGGTAIEDSRVISATALKVGPYRGHETSVRDGSAQGGLAMKTLADGTTELAETEVGSGGGSTLTTGTGKAPQALGMLDRQGGIAQALNRDGSTSLAEMHVGPNDGSTLTIRAMHGAHAGSMSDAAGGIAEAVDIDGKRRVASLHADTVSAGLSAAQRFRTARLVRTSQTVLPAEYVYIPTYGQSLSLGARAYPKASASARFPEQMRMFRGGPLPQGYSSDTASVYGTLVPLQEIETLAGFNTGLYLIDQPGETPLTGLQEAVLELLDREDGINASNTWLRLVGSCSGQGGTGIPAFLPGNLPYNRLLQEVAAAKAIADAEGRSFIVPAVTWMQGEADYGSEQAAWKAAFLQVYEGIDSGIRAITGQSQPVELVTYQTQYSPGPVAWAQWEAARDHPHIHMAGPIYWLQPTNAPWLDNLHLCGRSSKIAGAYLGQAIKRICFDRDEWAPLQPLAISKVGSAITVDLALPGTTGIVFDSWQLATSFVQVPANAGFRLYDSAGAAIAINSVEITGRSRVRLVAASAPGAGAYLTHGEAGGVIRDDEGSLVRFDPEGMDIPLHNHLVAFKHIF